MSENQEPLFTLTYTVRAENLKAIARDRGVRFTVTLIAVYLACMLLSPIIFMLIDYAQAGLPLTFFFSWLGEGDNLVRLLFSKQAWVWGLMGVWTGFCALYYLHFMPRRYERSFTERFPDGLTDTNLFFDDHLVGHSEAPGFSEEHTFRFADVRLQEYRSTIQVKTRHSNGWIIHKDLLSVEETARVRAFLKSRCGRKP